jgi:hypothetical protein
MYIRIVRLRHSVSRVFPGVVGFSRPRNNMGFFPSGCFLEHQDWVVCSVNSYRVPDNQAGGKPEPRCAANVSALAFTPYISNRL